MRTSGHHIRMLIRRCFSCAKPQDDRALVYFGPGEFVKCTGCGVWKTTEWAEGEAQIQVYASTTRARQAKTTTQAAVFVSVGALAAEAGSRRAGVQTRAPRFSYPVPLSLRAQPC